MSVRVNIRVPQKYPPYCITLLETLFADRAAVTITKHFTEGQSGTYVFLVEPLRLDGENELPVVVKLGPQHLLEAEWRAAHDYIANRLPDFVPISGQLAAFTVNSEEGGSTIYSAAQYRLVGSGIFTIETLRAYALTATAPALWTVLTKRLFPQLDQIWKTTDPPLQRSVRATYDRVLPVNLLLEATALPPLSSPALTRLRAAHDPATYQQAQPGDWVQVEQFVVTEIDATDRSLTLDLPVTAGLRTGAYRLRIYNVANLAAYQLHAPVAQVVGRVVTNRPLRLQAAVRAALPATLDLTRLTLQAPGIAEPLPNPLLHWPTLLAEQLPMRIGTVHGDLNLGNVLVDVEAKSTFVIDCAHARRDHALYDLVRLESEIVLHLVAAQFFQFNLPPTTIYDLYNWLAYVAEREPNPAGFFSIPQPLLQTMPHLQSAYIALATIRNQARSYLATANAKGNVAWREYNVALILTLLGSLKFASLDQATAGMNPKAVAFWGVATLLARLHQPLDLMHIGWRQIGVHAVPDQPSQVTLDERQIERDQRSNLFVEDDPSRQTAVQRLSPRRIKILLLAANPLGSERLQLDEEVRAIDQALRQAEYRSFDLIPHLAVRIEDLQPLLLRHQPDIVHFSGHGTATNELLLHDTNGNAVPVSGSILRALFTTLRDQVRCVVLNACDTQEQAASLAQVIDCVIGIRNQMPETAAIQFATAFYQALGFGRSVQEAFALGQIQADLPAQAAGGALQLYGDAAASVVFVDRVRVAPGDQAGSASNAIPTPVVERPQPKSALNFPLLLWQGTKGWFNDFFQIAAASDHMRSSWAGMTLYLLGAPFRQLSSENILNFLLAVLMAVLAIWFIAPLLAWPQVEEATRRFAAIRFGAAAIVLPALLAFLIEPEGVDKFGPATPQTVRKLTLLKLAGAWTGFGALAGTALVIAISWYHLSGLPLPTPVCWILAILPLFFAYVSARRMPLDRYKMFNGELRLHEADRLFFAVFALFGPLLAAVMYWGHWFLINPAAMLGVLLGIIGVTVWEIHRHDPERFPDLIVIALLGLLLPLGLLLLFFFDMAPLGVPPTFALAEVGLFVTVAIYILSTTLLLATVLVRQRTVVRLGSMVGLLLIMSGLLLVLLLDPWVGRAVVVSTVLLWYLWGRRQARARQWLWIHPSLDLLCAAMIGTMLLSRYTTVAVSVTTAIFALIVGGLTRWAYRQDERAGAPSSAPGTPPITWSIGWGLVSLAIAVMAGVALLMSRDFLPSAPLLPTPSATATTQSVVTVAAAPTIKATTSVTPTTTPTLTNQRATIARLAPGDHRYFIHGPQLDYELGQLLAVYGFDAGGFEFDAAVVFVVDKNVNNLIVQVIFQQEAYSLDSLAALQLDAQLASVDLASMKPVDPTFVGFILSNETARLVADAAVDVGDQLEAVRLTSSGDTLSFPDGGLFVHIDAISTGRKEATVSAPTDLPPIGTLLVKPTASPTTTPAPALTPTLTATVAPITAISSALPIDEAFDGRVKLSWEAAGGEWGVNNQRLQVRRFEQGQAGVRLAQATWPRYRVRLEFGTLQHLADSGNVNVPFTNVHLLIHFQGGTDGYWFTVANGGTACTKYQNGVSTALSPPVTQWGEMQALLMRTYTGDHEVAIIVDRNEYTFTLDDKPICNFQDSSYPQGTIGVVVTEGASGFMWIDNLRIEQLD